MECRAADASRGCADNRAKTDRVDAELIARLIAQEHTRLRPYTPPTANQRKLDRLIRRRAKIVRIRSTLKLTMSNLSCFTAELKAALCKLDALIAKIDASMSAIAACSPQHEETQQHLETIVGVGPLVGMALANTLGASLSVMRMRSSHSPASTREPMTPATKPAAGVCQNAAPPSCAVCCLMLRCPLPRPKSGSRSTSITAPRVGARPQRW